MEAIARIRTTITEFNSLANSDLDPIEDGEDQLEKKSAEDDAWHLSAPLGGWMDPYAFEAQQKQLDATYEHFHLALRRAVSHVLGEELDRFTTIQVYTPQTLY